jgi:cytochrome c biogenesis factor
MSSATTAELAALARRDAQKANRDARTLNAITILGFVYLPASFVATLLGTQYISIHSDADGGHVSVSFAREMWIFVILTVLLLAVTVGSWGVWERRMRRVELREAKAGDVV